MANLVINSMRLANLARYHSFMSARRLAGLYAVNLLAILATAGLLIPWAVVRVARYRLQSMAIEVEEPVADVAAAIVGEVTATGAEMSEMFDIDLAL
jgi:uncharacterized membrane protein YjgN (DUF898 family)